MPRLFVYLWRHMRSNMNQKKKDPGKQDRWFPVFCISCLLVMAVNFFVVRLAVVQGRSMNPTLWEGEHLVVWQLGYEPEAGDIVVIDTSESWKERSHIVKRIIGLPGQTVTVDYDSNTVTVEETLLEEPYINYSEDDPMQMMEGQQIMRYTVPDNCVFVLGDNRNHSSDSRNARYGMIPIADIMGKVVKVF